MSTVEKKIPFGISIISSGVAGCVYEIHPLLLKHKCTQKELDSFAEKLMDVLEGIQCRYAGQCFGYYIREYVIKI